MSAVRPVKNFPPRDLELGNVFEVIGSYLFWCHWFLRSLVELFDSLLIVAEVFLATNEDNGEALTEM